ncbi:MAG: T9SS type A sorting domain-containing protein [Candidatus Delongbacteria bacterium]|nr:T9SS type A sorting domain-containing protein [Candidatus Delongbacteria bacterium]
MKRILTLILVISMLPLFSGSSKTVYVGILQPDGVSEYDAGTIDNVTFQAWLEQGSGPAIVVPSLGQGGYPEEPFTEVTQLEDFGSEVKILAYRGAVKFEMEHFTAWGIGNILHVFMIDENDGLKNCFYNTRSWVIDDVTSGVKGIGMVPLMPDTGLPAVLNSCGSIDQNGYTPNSTSLKQNYPNPFNPTTTIEFDIEKKGMVSLNIFNQEGKIVRNAVDNFMTAGKHSVGVDLSNVSAGTYYYILKVDGVSEAKKMVLVK